MVLALISIFLMAIEENPEEAASEIIAEKVNE
jgi:hypothetical protein